MHAPCWKCDRCCTTWCQYVGPIWLIDIRYADDTFIIQNQNTGLNVYSTSIQLTLTYSSQQRNPTQMDLYPFWIHLLHQDMENTLLRTVYRKPTHSDQYLHWDSHHNPSAKYSVFNIITHRTRRVCANPQLLHKEKHIRGPSRSVSFLIGH